MVDADGGIGAATEREIETFLDRWMVEKDIPGASIALLDRDGVRYANGLGTRNVESRAPATPDTLYSIASVTKTFTAIATLQLADRGVLALDDEIREHVDYWNDVPGDPITVEELLSHSSGMPLDYAGQREFLFSESAPTSPLVTREDVVRHVNGASDRRVDDPGGFLYSNRGYLILGEIIERASDRRYSEYVEEEVMAPLGMDRSRVGYGQLSEAADDVAVGHAVEDGEPAVVDHDLAANARRPYSAGGILSSVTELSSMVRCLLNGGELDGTRVLDPDLVDAMSTHQAPPWTTIDGQDVGYGYGMRVNDFLGETLAGHTGTAGPVGRAYAGLLRERGIGVALGVNTSDVPIDQLARGVLAIAVGEDPGEVVPYVSLREKVAAVTGTYEGYRGGLTATVEAADSGAHLEVAYQDGPGWEFPAFPESTDRDDYAFYTVRESGLRDPVTFHDTDDGMEMRCNVDCLRRTSTGTGS